jgi:hypothetical protein
MQYQVKGQYDVSLAVGAIGDKTTTVAVAAGTHVKLINNDTFQRIIYSIKLAPVFPADWEPLESRQELLVFLAGGAQIHLRKKEHFRYSSIGQTADRTNNIPPEVPATVTVTPVNIS